MTHDVAELSVEELLAHAARGSDRLLGAALLTGAKPSSRVAGEMRETVRLARARLADSANPVARLTLWAVEHQGFSLRPPLPTPRTVEPRATAACMGWIADTRAALQAIEHDARCVRDAHVDPGPAFELATRVLDTLDLVDRRLSATRVQPWALFRELTGRDYEDRPMALRELVGPMLSRRVLLEQLVDVVARYREGEVAWVDVIVPLLRARIAFGSPGDPNVGLLATLQRHIDSGRADIAAAGTRSRGRRAGSGRRKAAYAAIAAALAITPSKIERELGIRQ